MNEKREQIWTTESQREFIATAPARIAELEAENAKLRKAATFALRRIAEYNAGGTIETPEMMKRAQKKLYDALEAK